MKTNIVTLNSGSSSLKFSVFDANDLSLNFYGQVSNITKNPSLTIKNSDNREVFCRKDFESGHDIATKLLYDWIQSNIQNIIAVGHRIVHGGRNFSKAVKITPKILDELKALIPLAPLHQPSSISIIEIFSKLYPKIPQIACFDTSFHSTQLETQRHFALPKKYQEEGIISYGFHGLSYEYITSVLPEYSPRKANDRVIVAHLGNGASACAIKNSKSQATTMSFTPLDGLMMASRSGSIDPGVILYLLEEKNMSAKEISNLLYQESGLKGVSGFSSDMHELLQSTKIEAKKAVELFCYKAAKQISSLIPAINGLDVLVFTAGIGENSPEIRKNICDHLSWLGLKLDEKDNKNNQNKISAKDSKIEIYVIKTNEEKIIAKQVLQQIN